MLLLYMHERQRARYDCNIETAAPRIRLSNINSLSLKQHGIITSMHIYVPIDRHSFVMYLSFFFR